MSVDIYSKDLRNNIKAMVSKSVTSNEDQDDISQDVYLKILKYAKTESPEKFFSWLKLAVKSSIGDFYRKKSTQQSFNDELDFSQNYPEEELNDSILCCIDPFLKQLPDKDSNLIKQIDLNNINQKDLAKELGINYSTLKSQVQKARKELMNLIVSCCSTGKSNCSDPC